MLRQTNDNPTFAQIYFYDANLDNQLQRRKELFPILNTEMLRSLQNELNDVNPFVHSFISIGKQARDENISNMTIVIHNVHGRDMRQYNQPTAPEVAAILPDGQMPNLRDIVMETYQGELKHISELHGAYDPLQYPLLFPHGEYGWTDNILRANEVESRPESQIGSQTGSMMDVDIYEGESRHTGATQFMEDLTIGPSSSFSMIEPSKSKDKGKGKQKEVESDKEDDESEIVSGDEDLDSLEIQQEVNKRKRLQSENL